VSDILLYQSLNTKLSNLESALAKKGHSVVLLSDIADLDTKPAQVDLTIVDVSCGLDGVKSCRAVSKALPGRPLILLVAEDASIDQECQALTGGNVLQLPFTCRKVTNRINKLLSCRTGNILRAGELVLNLEARCVTRGANVHRLTPRQAKLLEVFMRHAEQTLTRKFLMETVWETDYMGDTRTLDVHVRWIRERIELDPSAPKYLRTVRGIGYRFGVPTSDEA
jgi:DNA-binding response OmpR family regulator